MADERDLNLVLGALVPHGYEMLGELGRGSFGCVYKARQQSTGQEVAIKTLRLRDGDGAGTVIQTERFRREMRVCAGLSHPNIVRLIDSGESPAGALYAVFEFVPGATLEQVLATETTLAPREALHLMTQLLDALACAHARGIVHRDLKPGNVMVSKTGLRRNAMILDFGLGGLTHEAREQHAGPHLTASGEMMGTPGYAAPEQLRGEPPSPRSDLYSWGLVFLECLTGAAAFRGGSGHEVILKQLGPDPVPIPAWLRTHQLGALLAAVVVKPVERRDMTAEQVLQALHEAELAGLPTPGALPAGPARLPEGERRQLTVVSCRVSATATDDTGLDVEELDQLLHTQHVLYARLAERNGGHVASVQADRALLVFGYPQAGEDDARRAARTALQIVEEVTHDRTATHPEHGPRLEVRIGVHTGLVIARETHHATRRGLYDVVGLTPQIATELEHLAEPSQVLASVDTQRLLRDAVGAELIGEHRLGSGSQPVPVYRLTAGRGSASLPEPRLVGRAQQLRQLRECWGHAERGRGNVVLINGDAGIGKTRLLRELWRTITPAAWIECRCLAEAQGSPLRPFVDALRRLAEDDLSTFLSHYGLSLPEIHPLIATLLGVPLDARWPAPLLQPDRQKELTLDAVLAIVMRMAAERPLVLAVEDLHWADPTTLELVALLVGELGAAQAVDAEAGPRLCVVLTARSEFTPPWPLADVSAIQLPRLSAAEVEAMVVAHLAEGEALPPPVLRQIVQRSDGVPLFVEEVAPVLLGAAARPDGGGAARFEIPSSLRDLLTARLDHVSPESRQTAQLAAVLGREFRYDVLRAASTKREAALRRDLTELTIAGLVYRQHSARTESYVFKHALVRDAAYESMVRSARRSTHRRVAAALKEQFAETAEDRPETLAQHFEAGGALETAVEYWERAGERAMARGAYVESIRHFESGLALLGTLPSSRTHRYREIALTVSLGTALLATQGYASSAVEDKFAHALELCRQLGGDVPIKVLYGIWSVQFTRSNREATAVVLGEMEALGARSGDPVVLYSAHGTAGLRAFATGDFTQARHSLERATRWYDADSLLAFVRDYGYDGRLHVHGWLMWSLSVLGYPDRAAGVRTEMLTLAEQTANPYAIALALSFAATLAHDRREPEAARELTERALALAAEEKLYFWLATTTCVHGWAATALGDLDPGIEEMQRGLGMLQAIGIRAAYGFYLTLLVEGHLACGAVGEGLTRVEEGQTLCRTLLDRSYESELFRLEGELRLLAGDRRLAEAALRQSLAIASERAAKAFELRTASGLARLLRADGRDDEADRLLRGVYDWFSEGRDSRDLRDARTLLDAAPHQ